MLSRRGLLRLTAVVATMGWLPSLRSNGASTDGSAPIDPTAAQRIWLRLNGDLAGRTTWFTTVGDVWGFQPQADDLAVADFARRAYGYAGVVARSVRPRSDGALIVRQKGWAFYRDPESEQISDRIPNRWTGVVDTAPPLSGPVREEVLAVPHEASTGEIPDPYHMQVRRLGRHAFVSTSNMVRFKPRDATWFKLEGNLASHQCLAKDLDDPSLTHVPNTYSQNLVAEWQTWTHMHGEPGHILFKGDGLPLFEVDAIPEDLRRAIDVFFPGQMADVLRWA